MKTGRILLLMVVVAACAAGVWIVYERESNLAAKLEGEIALVKGENANLAREMAAAKEKDASSEAEAIQLRAARVIGGMRLEPMPQSMPLPQATPAASATPAEANEGGLVAKMLRDPRMLEMLEAQQATVLRGLYGDFLREAKLTPEETERFFRILEDRQMALMESSATAMGGGAVDVNAATAATKKADDAVRGLLGPEQFGQYQEFEKTLGQRVAVQQFNQELAGEGYPLQDFQSTALIRIMHEETAAMPRPGNGQSPGMSPAEMDRYARAMEAVNGRIYYRAKSVLTPPQLAAFAIFQKNMATAQLAGLRMAQGMMRGGNP